MRRILGTVLLLVAITACSDDDSSDKSCADIAADGRPTDDVRADLDAGTCKAEDGDDTIVITGDTACADDGRLWWNDYGWGYEGETWHRHPEGETTPSQDEFASCEGTEQPAS